MTLLNIQFAVSVAGPVKQGFIVFPPSSSVTVLDDKVIDKNREKI